MEEDEEEEEGEAEEEEFLPGYQNLQDYSKVHSLLQLDVYHRVISSAGSTEGGNEGDKGSQLSAGGGR